MTTAPRSLDLTTVARIVNQRLDRLERKLDPAFSVFQPEMVYTYSGALVASFSPVWVRRSAGRLTQVLSLLRVAGSSDTVLRVYKNEDVALEITIPASTRIWPVPTSLRYAPDADTLGVEIATAGTGAIDLTMIFRFNK